MREELAAAVGTVGDPVRAGNLTREFLQARVLAALQETGAMIPLAFQGGPALRFLFGLPRFSEDLDFALERPDRMTFDLDAAGDRIGTSLGREGYDVATSLQAGTASHRLMVGFPGLPYEMGLSPHKTQKLSIRVEVDTQPPEGAILSTTVVRRHHFLNLQHHDRSSLLAGKLHAVLQRPWVKGRDLFDLFWYLSDREWPEPNFQLLNNALTQSGWDGPALDAGSWKPIVADRVGSLEWDAAERDVAPFLEPGPAADAFGRDPLLGLLDSDMP